ILTFFSSPLYPRDLHSFPTRRSSDLCLDPHPAAQEKPTRHPHPARANLESPFVRSATSGFSATSDERPSVPAPVPPPPRPRAGSSRSDRHRAQAATGRSDGSDPSSPARLSRAKGREG